MQHYLDWILQSLLIMCGVAALIGTLTGYDLVALLFFTQLILVLWQYIGCWLTIRRPSWCGHHRKLYLQVSTAWFLVVICVMIFSTNTVAWNTMVHLIVFFIIPWCLAGYYYVLTCRRTFRNKNRGNFLPHLSF